MKTRVTAGVWIVGTAGAAFSACDWDAPAPLGSAFVVLSPFSKRECPARLSIGGVASPERGLTDHSGWSALVQGALAAQRPAPSRSCFSRWGAFSWSWPSAHLRPDQTLSRETGHVGKWDPRQWHHCSPRVRSARPALKSEELLMVSGCLHYLQVSHDKTSPQSRLPVTISQWNQGESGLNPEVRLWGWTVCVFIFQSQM